jgi:alkylhydroperoxidase/carboxymuconolactone decarboxylase family protein YurZ
MDRLKEISEHRETAHKKLLSLKSKVYEAFLEMEKVTYCNGALPKKTKELIAIGISNRWPKPERANRRFLKQSK